MHFEAGLFYWMRFNSYCSRHVLLFVSSSEITTMTKKNPISMRAQFKGTKTKQIHENQETI